MAELEPIVVTEAKKTVTPTLFKEDILTIIQQAIVNGEIQLPVGGTKLYRHEIGFDSTSSSGTGVFGAVPIYLINTSPNALNIDDVFDYFVGIGCVSMSDDNMSLGSEIWYDGETLSCYDTVGTVKAFTGITELIDTVTEL